MPPISTNYELALSGVGHAPGFAVTHMATVPRLRRSAARPAALAARP